MNIHLWDRVAWAHENLTPVRSDYVVVYEDGTPPAKVLIPAPEWLAMALHGGLLPPVEHYHHEPRDADGTFVGRPDYWRDYAPLPPLTEEEALEYLIQKDIPRAVWQDGSNHRFAICRRSQLPPTRRYRNAWVLA